jgi:hypothetical protein
VIHDRRSVLIAGLILIITGVGMVVPQLLHAESFYPWIPLLSGVMFIGAGAFASIPDFFVPGCLLASAGLGILLGGGADRSGNGSEYGVFLVFSLGVGFSMVSFLNRIFSKRRLLWPLVPGTALIVIGLLMAGR